ncbi:putative thioesterase family protein [Erysiphe necator]|uniref:Putative thioesterase family protein n=1 Tax=Uncinula necator TaxID=52586 RepID=A0A0B1P1L4_UNCNE|nr:putative thioesterase family protein [Erysiphe necator]
MPIEYLGMLGKHVRLLKRWTVCPNYIENIYRPFSSNTYRSISSRNELPVKILTQNSSKFRHAIRLCALGFFCSGAGFLMAATPAFKVADSFLNPPTDVETISLFTPEDNESKKIDDFINNHPLTLEMRSKPEYSESRPHLRIPEPLRPNNIIAGTLMGPDMLVVPPIVWVDKEEHSLVSIVYLGKNLCGHPNLIHGGLLATLLDECLARCCFTAFPNKIGMTATLNIDYRNPTPAGSYVLVRAKTTDVKGRKVWAAGHIESLPEKDKMPIMLAEASGLFIEPKQVAALSKIYPVL